MWRPARGWSAPTGDPHSEHERKGERLQRGLYGHLAKAIRPNDKGILRRSPARICRLLLPVRQPGGFRHCGGIVDIHEDLLLHGQADFRWGLAGFFAGASFACFLPAMGISISFWPAAAFFGFLLDDGFHETDHKQCSL
jgi:hypothetical protein